MSHTASNRPQPYVSPHNNLLHRGEVAFVGSTTIDLGIKHTNFQVTLSLQGGLAAQNIAPQLSWSKVSGAANAGKFLITAGKYTGAGDTTIIAATASCTVTFTAIAGASAE